MFIIIVGVSGKGIYKLVTSASLASFDAYGLEVLSANLSHTQPDYFGTHPCGRGDIEGANHTKGKLFS